MTPELADKIMTRIIARVEADGGVLHKSSGIEEIIGTCAVAEAEGEIIDIISHDGKQWVHKDGTPLDMGDDRVEPKGVTSEGFIGTVKATVLDVDGADRWRYFTDPAIGRIKIGGTF